MILIALKMLFGDKVKLLGLVAGIALPDSSALRVEDAMIER
jgi:hypothetical protein